MNEGGGATLASPKKWSPVNALDTTGGTEPCAPDDLFHPFSR